MSITTGYSWQSAALFTMRLDSWERRIPRCPRLCTRVRMLIAPNLGAAFASSGGHSEFRQEPLSQQQITNQQSEEPNPIRHSYLIVCHPLSSRQREVQTDIEMSSTLYDFFMHFLGDLYARQYSIKLHNRKMTINATGLVRPELEGREMRRALCKTFFGSASPSLSLLCQSRTSIFVSV